MGNIPNHPHGIGRLFQLTSPKLFINNQTIRFPGALVLTPEPIAEETMVIAWTYALRYSAKGLDLPDYDAALEMLIQRHPSWEIVDRHAHITNPDMRQDAEDVPEN